MPLHRFKTDRMPSDLGSYDQLRRPVALVDQATEPGRSRRPAGHRPWRAGAGWAHPRPLALEGMTRGRSRELLNSMTSGGRLSPSAGELEPHDTPGVIEGIGDCEHRPVRVLALPAGCRLPGGEEVPQAALAAADVSLVPGDDGRHDGRGRLQVPHAGGARGDGDRLSGRRAGRTDPDGPADGRQDPQASAAHQACSL